MKLSRFRFCGAVLVAALAVAAVGACDLNPQPLPPGPELANNDRNGDGAASGSFGGGGDAGTATPNEPADASIADSGMDANPNQNTDSGADGSDAGDDADAQ
jgi:hypothetical protein